MTYTITRIRLRFLGVLEPTRNETVDCGCGQRAAEVISAQSLLDEQAAFARRWRETCLLFVVAGTDVVGAQKERVA